MISFEELINRIEKYSEEIQLVILDAFTYFSARNSDDYISIGWHENNKPLISDGFLNIDKEYYHIYHIRDLIKNLDSISFPFPQTLRHNKDGSLSARAKQEWCKKNRDIVISYYPDAEYKLFVKVQPTPNTFAHAHNIREYLERKFIDNKQIHIVNGNRYEIISPCGSKVIDYENLIFEFPDDRITNLLNQYSANRCASKKPGLKINEQHFPKYVVSFHSK